MYWVAHVLQDLVAEDQVEGSLLEGEGVGVRGEEGDVGEGLVGSEGAGLLEDGGGEFHTGDVALWDQPGEIDGDGAGPAADVEDVHVWAQVGEEVGGRVGGCAPGVGAEDGGVVAVSVGCGFFFLHFGFLFLFSFSIDDVNRCEKMLSRWDGYDMVCGWLILYAGDVVVQGLRHRTGRTQMYFTYVKPED